MSPHLLVAFLILAALVSGAIYEALSARADPARHPPPGRLIPVDGVRLHLNCSGEGSPVVVLESGLGDSSLVWADVQSSLSASNRVCSYDRAGLAWSEPAVNQWTAKLGVAQLHELLHRGGESPPYVLVGHSAGASYVRLFALTYPEETLAIVLVEPPLLSHLSPTLAVPLKAIRATLGVLSRFGVVRLLGRLGWMRLLFSGSTPPASLSDAAGFLYRPQSIRASIQEVDALNETIGDLIRHSTPGVYGDRPLVIISAHPQNGPQSLADALNRLAQLSRKGNVVRLPGSHFVHFDQPAALVSQIERAIKDSR